MTGPRTTPGTTLTALTLVLAASACMAPMEDASLEASGAALSPEDCVANTPAGKVAICHATDSASNAYTVIEVSTKGCAKGHAKHAGDTLPDVHGQCCAPSERDCDGVCGGDAALDCNGVCGGAAALDCNGICGGAAVVDCNGVCSAPVGPGDFGTDGPTVLTAGSEITQLLGAGLSSVSCSRNDTSVPGHCILFDTENPTGGQYDFGTPNETFGGPGVGLGGQNGQVGKNDTIHGLALVIADDVVDADLDGRVDDPASTAAGGVISITFAAASTVHTVTLLDIDSDEDGMVLVHLQGGGTIGYPAWKLGDNSMQVVQVGATGVIAMDLHLSSTGALAEFEITAGDPLVCGCTNHTDCLPSQVCQTGYCIEVPTSIEGLTFLDADGDGTFAGSDTPLAGVAVTLHADANADGIPDDLTPLASAVSNYQGIYSFDAPASQTFVVAFQDLSLYGYAFTTPNVGSDATDSDVLASGFTAPVATPSSGTIGDIFAGYLSP
jgi:SdrD B-like domain